MSATNVRSTSDFALVYKEIAIFFEVILKITSIKLRDFSRDINETLVVNNTKISA